MGSMHGRSFRDQLGKEKGLEMHLRTQFFPPHPEYVVKSTIEGFKKYWEGEIDETELAQDYCYLRSVDGLNRYYQMFLDDEGPCDDEPEEDETILHDDTRVIHAEDVMDGEYDEVV